MDIKQVVTDYFAGIFFSDGSDAFSDIPDSILQRVTPEMNQILMATYIDMD